MQFIYSIRSLRRSSVRVSLHHVLYMFEYIVYMTNKKKSRILILAQSEHTYASTFKMNHDQRFINSSP